MMLRKLIGDRAFYRHCLAVAIPIIIQNAITNFVALLDNIMVGQVGTLEMSGVAIVNQLIFVFNLCIFGACSGAGIFTAQFFGSQDHEGVRHTFRFKLIANLLLSLIGIGIFALGGERLIGLYLQGDGDPAHAAQILFYGKKYLAVMMIGFVPFALSGAYASTLRESGQTTVPMVAGICAVVVNLVLNYVLIFGHLGFPALGAEGAAIATVISRFVELAVVAMWTHLHPNKNPFIRGAYRSMYIPGSLMRKIIVKGMPLLVNEFFWASGMAIMRQCYSTCGLDVVPAMNISTVFQDLGSVVYLSMGNAVGIIMGQMMGAGESRENVRDANNKLIFVSVAAGVIFGGLMASLSGVFPSIYREETAEVRHLATQLILVSACVMPVFSYANASYFTLRSGGQTLVTFLFDSVFVWVVSVPLAFCLSRFTDLPIVPLYAICVGVDIFKCVVGFYMIQKGVWIKNLTEA
jgi:putative MATE family efflux protein